MKKRLIIAAEFTACLVLCAIVWPQTERGEKIPTPSKTTAVTAPQPILPKLEELMAPAITEKQESEMSEAESATEVAAEELPIPAPEDKISCAKRKKYKRRHSLQTLVE